MVDSEEADDSSDVGLGYWRLCDRFTVVQAALLIVGHDPSTSFAEIEQWSYAARPVGYEAAKHALVQALERDSSFGRIVRVPISDGEISDRKHPVDVEKSIVWTHSIKSWLSEQGIKKGFFVSKAIRKLESDIPDYLDPENPRYAPKLAASIKAWVCVGEQSATTGKSAKHALTKWLTENAAELGLVNSRGKANASGIKEAAKVANWQLMGGAPKTPGRS